MPRDFSVKDVLGYSRNEIVGQWFGRFLPTSDLEKFEANRKIYCKSDDPLESTERSRLVIVGNGQQTPSSVCDVFDMYAENGERRLTFACQIRPSRERRSKSVKYSIVAQLIE